jgi:hypothetical protein
VHDATSFCEIYQTEMLRFCSEGAGGRRMIENGGGGIGLEEAICAVTILEGTRG